MLWMILTLMTVLVAVGLAVPLLRRRDPARGRRADAVSVLKAQLGEIENQASAGALAPSEADALKADLKRRVLAEGRQAEPDPRPLGERSLLILALGTVAVVALAGTGLYLRVGRPDVPASPAIGGQQAASASSGDHPQGDVASMIAMLETQLRQQPENAEGWRMLGWSYLQTGRNADAATAYARAAALAPNNAEYLSAQGEATVLAADGQVTPQAEAVFRKALAADPQDPRARYFLAVAKDQRGDQAGAMADWIALLKDAPPDAPWAAQVRDFVQKVAAQRGVDLAGRLPPGPASPGAGAQMAAAPRGPTQQDVAAAADMSTTDRQAMIDGMVTRLATRLKENPRDVAGWNQLLRARMVLGQTDQAAADFRAASQALAGSPAEQASLREAARALGVPVG